MLLHHVFKEVKIKTTKCHHLFIRMTKIQNPETTKWW